MLGEQMKKTAREIYDEGKPIDENSTQEEWNERLRQSYAVQAEEGPPAWVRDIFKHSKPKK